MRRFNCYAHVHMEYYRKTSHTVFDCTYQIVWITKYRYSVLVHVHIYVSIPPYLSVSKLVQYLKGKTSRKIQQEFPELRKKYWGQHLWATGYFVRTAGNVTDQIIKDYIDKHQGKDDKYGDFQVGK